MEEDEIPEVLGGELQDDRWRCVFLSRQDENIVDEEVRVGVGCGRDITVFFGGLQDGVDNVGEDSCAEVGLHV